LFPPVAAKYPFRGKGIYRFYGKVVSEFGFLSIEVVKMQKPDYIQDPRYVEMKTSNRMRFSGEKRKDPVEDI
jgi:DNA polymerase-3 subunit alpha